MTINHTTDTEAVDALGNLLVQAPQIMALDAPPSDVRIQRTARGWEACARNTPERRHQIVLASERDPPAPPREDPNLHVTWLTPTTAKAEKHSHAGRLGHAVLSRLAWLRNAGTLIAPSNTAARERMDAAYAHTVGALAPWARLVVIEGIDGAGKSTQARAITERLQARGETVVSTREPGGTGASEAIRDILITKQTPALQRDSELLLVYAARSEHLHQVIRPALARGHWVVCDRFTLSTLVYQCSGRGVDPAHAHALARWIHPDIQPALTVVLKTNTMEARARKARAGNQNHIDKRSDAFFALAAMTYQGFISQGTADHRIAGIDATPPAHSVTDAIMKALETQCPILPRRAQTPDTQPGAGATKA